MSTTLHATPDLLASFGSVHNHSETAVFEAVQAMSPQYPGLADDPELLADVACVALNRLQPRYIRHQVDFAFYLSERERSRQVKLVQDAVEHAFGFVQARRAMRARG
jgi:tryptophanase